MLTTGNQLRAARALIGMDQKQLAQKADVALNTLRAMEAVGAEMINSRARSLIKVQQALELAGVEFLNHGRPGVRMK
ncbi:MAG: hypothetical protein CME88_02755 [Hirschia sp.]|nr:hypothetical protein [Hirschia sp.]MBF17282.1 hypothetical protein [Hirschia sp.]|tara:strand:+ start:296 stop:526 length:231 start_codon:yes stop_codon:yes gene_type:complete